MKIEDLVRKHLIGLKPYASARSEYSGEGILLDANENSIDSTIKGSGLNRYPDPLQRTLKSRILAWLNPELTINHLFLGNGSDEAIDLLIRGFCEPGRDEILICPPVFGMYEKSAQINNVQVKRVDLLPGFQLNVDEIKASIWEHTKIIFICSPNNPSGNLINSEDIKIILNSFEGLLVVDEAYMDFTDAVSWVNFIDRYPQLLVLRTFSKVWGLAGLRLGVMAGNPDVVEVLNTIKMPYNVNSATLDMAHKAFESIDYMESVKAELIAERIELAKHLKWLDIVREVHPSDANYLLVRFEDAAQVYDYLKQHGIIVRNRSNLPLCANSLRITIGSPGENKLLLDLLKTFDDSLKNDADDTDR